MIANFGDTSIIKQTKEALLSLGIEFTKKEMNFFSDLVSDLCICMSLNESKLEYKSGNEALYDRMNKVGGILNSDEINELEREFVVSYLNSCRLELANFGYEIGLRRFNNDVNSCCRKINDSQNVDDTLIQFARIMYNPVEEKEENISKNKVLIKEQV